MYAMGSLLMSADRILDSGKAIVKFKGPQGGYTIFSRWGGAVLVN